MRKTRFYYLIEELDIDGDKQADGFLVSQYKLDKYKNKIFTKNKYITFEDFKNYAQQIKLKNSGGNPPNQVITMTVDEYNKLMQSKKQQETQVVTMTKEEFSNLMNNKSTNPPHIAVQGQQGTSFVSNVGSGIGLGLGFGLGNGLMESIFG